MNVTIRCASCIIHRGYLAVKEATDDSVLQFNAISSLLDLVTAEFTSQANPAHIGTKRDRLIKQITNNPDPFRRKKRISNEKALEVLPWAKEIVSKEPSLNQRFRKASLCSIVGNVIEFDIPDNPFEFSDLPDLLQRAEADLVIDDITLILKEVQKAKTVLYLTDNAGEIAFDTLLINVLHELGASVTVAVKGGPVHNDATIEDAYSVGVHKLVDQIITTGTDAVGFLPEECSKEFLNAYASANFVVAKGMGYAETLTEHNLPSPHALFFRTKCKPVADFFNVQTGGNVAKLMY